MEVKKVHEVSEMSKTVYVVGGDPLVCKMFEKEGWKAHPAILSLLRTTWSSLNDPLDLVCFTGGADVSPYLYGEENISSHCDPLRDEFEKEVYEEFVNNVPMVGICRGGQFLNVMNGGKMIQHIPGHSHGDRLLRSGYDTGVTFTIREDHHQGMIEAPGADVLAEDPRDNNPEIIWYPNTKCLCFQPHPEWGHKGTKELFFSLLEDYLDL